ncbi:MAG: GerAB/ArcD/ProY family transporter [Bacilli bacterium]
MNNKVSSVQVGMLFSLIISSMYLGLNDILILRKSANNTLIAIIIGSIIGIIPVLMYLKINNYYPSLNIYQKNVKLFGKVLGNVFNVFFVLIFIISYTIAIRSTTSFLSSKYLHLTPFFVIGILVVLTTLVISFKRLETISRISQITFVIIVILVIYIEFSLINYVELNNIFPMLTNSNNFYSILNGSLYYAGNCGLMSILLLSIKKDYIKDPKNYSKSIIIFYILTNISLVLVTFYVISCLGYKMSYIFKYPEYILLKKINISNNDLRIENLLSFRWIFYLIALANISLHGLITYFKETKIKTKKQSVIIILISISCLFIATTVLQNTSIFLVIMEHYFMLIFIIPVFIVFLIIFIRCLFIPKSVRK